MDSPADEDATFQRALDGELEKICSFFQVKELEVFADVSQVIKDAQAYASETHGVDMEPVSDTIVKARRKGRYGSRSGTDVGDFRLGSRGDGPDRRPSTISQSVDEDVDSDEDEGDMTASFSGKKRRGESTSTAAANAPDDDPEGDSLATSQVVGHSGPHGDRFRDPEFLSLYNAGVSLKKQAIEAYVSLCELKSFVQLNRTGFSKALKKYDKILDRGMRGEYMNTTVSEAYPFTTSTHRKLQRSTREIEDVYANVVTKGDVQLARRELRLHLREHVAWERNTVWREMIGIERKAQAANVGVRNTLLGGPRIQQQHSDRVMRRRFKPRSLRLQWVGAVFRNGCSVSALGCWS